MRLANTFGIDEEPKCTQSHKRDFCYDDPCNHGTKEQLLCVCV